MATRAYWTGNIRLSLVSIPIQVIPATKTGAQISFHQVHKPSGERIRYQKVAPGIGPVDTDEIVKGYELEKGKYVLLEDEEIDKLKLEAKRAASAPATPDSASTTLRRYSKSTLGKMRLWRTCRV